VITFDVVAGADKGKTLEFDKLAITIGRSAECDFVVSDPGASREHATVRYVSGRFVLENRSSNGTLLNGKEISSEKLKAGDLIELGESTGIRVKIKGAQKPPGGPEPEEGGAEPAEGQEEAVPLYKKPLVLIIGGGYLVAIIVLAIFLSAMETGPEKPPPRKTAMTSDDFLFSLLGGLPKVEPDSALAEKHARQALHYFSLHTPTPPRDRREAVSIADLPRPWMWGVAQARLALAYWGQKCQTPQEAGGLLGGSSGGGSTRQELNKKLNAMKKLCEGPIAKAYGSSFTRSCASCFAKWIAHCTVTPANASPF